MSAARNIAASIRQRLLEESKRRGVDFDAVLVRFATERILSRLSHSKHADRFVLKGAMLYAIWSADTPRPTRDMDLLGFGSNDAAEVRGVFRELLTMDTAQDGLAFDLETLSVGPIRALDGYGGLEVKFIASLDGARISTQIDIGYGDVITPGPEKVEFPALLPEFESPTIRAYPVYTVFAEKLEAAVRLGDVNGRMKDFYDLWFLAQKFSLDSGQLNKAIQATFDRRGTPLPAIDDQRLMSPLFAEQKTKSWGQFLKRNALPEPMNSFSELTQYLRGYVFSVLKGGRARASNISPKVPTRVKGRDQEKEI